MEPLILTGKEEEREAESPSNEKEAYGRQYELTHALFKLHEIGLNAYVHGVPVTEGIEFEMRSANNNDFGLYMQYQGRYFEIGHGNIIPRQILIDSERQDGTPQIYPTIRNRILSFFVTRCNYKSLDKRL